jgi:hypothetical protein
LRQQFPRQCTASSCCRPAAVLCSDTPKLHQIFVWIVLNNLLDNALSSMDSSLRERRWWVESTRLHVPMSTVATKSQQSTSRFNGDRPCGSKTIAPPLLNRSKPHLCDRRRDWIRRTETGANHLVPTHKSASAYVLYPPGERAVSLHELCAVQFSGAC